MTTESLSQKSGIYKITNTVNQKIYVGSSVNIAKRFNAHKNSLIKNIHHSKTMQRSWNKYGKDSFIFNVIEFVEIKENLLIREQHYLDTLNPFGKNGFNNEKIAGSHLGIKHSEETKKKMSESRLSSTLTSPVTPDQSRKYSMTCVNPMLIDCEIEASTLFSLDL